MLSIPVLLVVVLSVVNAQRCPAANGRFPADNACRTFVDCVNSVPSEVRFCQTGSTLDMNRRPVRCRIGPNICNPIVLRPSVYPWQSNLFPGVNAFGPGFQRVFGQALPNPVFFRNGGVLGNPGFIGQGQFPFAAPGVQPIGGLGIPNIGQIGPRVLPINGRLRGGI